MALSGTAYATNKVGPQDIAKNAVRSQHIKNGQVKGADLAAGSVNSNAIAEGGVGSADLAPGSVGAAQLAPGSVGSANLLGGSVSAGALAPGAVGSSAIADGSVTPADTGTIPAVQITGGGSNVAAEDKKMVNIPWDDDVLQGLIDFDTDNMHSYTVEPERFKVHTAGVYLIDVQIAWAAAASANGTRRLGLSAGPGFETRIGLIPGSTSAIDQGGSFLVRLKAGDEALVRVSQNSGATVNVNGLHFAMYWVGP